MAEMEKEGRPPENKRSRKPAHPVKREINEEMKNFAENTMNELLGWYGYDKVELKDGEDIEFRNYSADGESRQHISVLKENSLPKPKLPEDSVISPYNINPSYPGLATGNGLSDSPAGSKDHGNVPIIVPLIPPPFIKPPAEDDVSNVQIMCAWCQKVGIKRYSLSMGSEVKCFCSEKCFAACRRAYFKRNKVDQLYKWQNRICKKALTTSKQRQYFDFVDVGDSISTDVSSKMRTESKTTSQWWHFNRKNEELSICLCTLSSATITFC